MKNKHLVNLSFLGLLLTILAIIVLRSYYMAEEFTIWYIFLIIAFLIFLINTSYLIYSAQKIINKQLQNNDRLEKLKLQAKIDSSAKAQFLSTVSHEMRNPINTIIGFSDMIATELHGKLENEKYREYINNIGNSGHNLLKIVNDTSDFSKALMGKLEIEMIKLDLCKLAFRAMKSVEQEAEKHNIRLIKNLPAKIIVIKADMRRLNQVFLNLLLNKIKFLALSADKEIIFSIKTDNVKKIVYISIENKITNQENERLKNEYKTNSLWLSFTQKLIELMDGTFYIKDSEKKRTVTTITFNLLE